MSIKGYPTQQKLVSNQSSKNEHVTVQPTDINLRNALDTVTRFAFRVNDAVTPRTAGANTGNPADNSGTVIVDTATPARVGDFVRFETGLAQYLEIPIIEVSVNSFKLGARLPTAYAPAAGDTFFIMRYATQQVDSSGSQIVITTPGPTQFVRDGVDAEVEEDTVNPANSLPLPVKILGSYLSSVRLDYSVSNVDNAAWTELVADTGAEVINSILLFDGGGFAMELGIGAALSEVRTLLIPPGGFNGPIPFHIPINSRISIRAIGAALVDAGEIDINFMR